MRGGWIIGLDIGGTFTDSVMTHPRTSRMVRFKCLSTPDDPSRGALTGVAGVIAEAGVEPRDISVVLHATTLVSNALIERRGARTALVATRGFADVLKIGREKKYDIYDLQLEKPMPLVAEELALEVAERTGPGGEIIQPLDESSVAEVADALRRSGAEAVGICLLHSYMNPAHERRVRALIEQHLPDVSVCVSSDVLPEIREFERASTTVANAFVQPLIATYLRRLSAGLAAAGLDCALFIMLSEGGMAAPEIVRRLPVRICESGPAAGAVTAASIGRRREVPRILSFDMGGTTAKSCLVHAGKPDISMDFEVARAYRLKKGSGLPLRIPVVDLIEIGAGGGSIVRVDRLGLINVGPDSSGAAPGPACYGLGGQHPTVTDADLVLGYLDPGSFLGGRMRLDASAARSAIERHVARPLGLSVEEAALSIHEIVNESMANASRLQAVERGHDPAGYTLVAFGGAGPVHAWGVARRLRLRSIIVPPSAGLGSAVGLLLAPRTYRTSRTHIGILETIEWKRVGQIFAELTAEASAVLREAGIPARRIRYLRSVDMRYHGQRKELTIAVPTGPIMSREAKLLRAAFETAYGRVYHRTHPGHPIETLAWRLAAIAPAVHRPRTTRAGAGGGKAPAIKAGRRRPMLFTESAGLRMCDVFSRADIPPGTRLRGPAVIEEAESTAVIGPGGSAHVDRDANLIIDVALGSRS
jgi:N-methylhydantoinase A